MPSFNEITGARISSGVHVKGTDEEAFRSGWDLLWGKKEAPAEEGLEAIPFDSYTAELRATDGCCHKTVIERCEDCSLSAASAPCGHNCPFKE